MQPVPKNIWVEDAIVTEKETSSVIKYRTKFGVQGYKLDQRGICENSPKEMHN